jgi:hypothetical protein
MEIFNGYVTMLPQILHVPMQDYKVLEQGKAICHVQRLGDGTPTRTAGWQSKQPI